MGSRARWLQALIILFAVAGIFAVQGAHSPRGVLTKTS
jgi:hypothetical protein